MRTIRARAPAKLILSGEHAVVYGNPALAIAVTSYAESTAALKLSREISFNFLNLKYVKDVTIQTLSLLKERLHRDYKDFQSGHCTIRDVLKKPFELLQYTTINLFEKLNIPLSNGMHIKTHSDIPIGCGMGSSAATVISMLFALSHYLKLDLKPQDLLNLGKEAENLQHGYSSGLDLYMALHGGCVRFQSGSAEKRPIPTVPFYLVHTGRPETNTGECVAAVAPLFTKGALLNDFEQVTNGLDLAFNNQDISQVQNMIKENHKLLTSIKVVPKTVQTFIHTLEQSGFAAKICGAGSIRGEGGGMVLVVAETETDQDINPIIAKFGYRKENLSIDMFGAHLV